MILAAGLLKVCYLAPAKALVQEKVREWQQRFGSTLGFTVKEVTGRAQHPPQGNTRRH